MLHGNICKCYHGALRSLLIETFSVLFFFYYSFIEMVRNLITFINVNTHTLVADWPGAPGDFPVGRCTMWAGVLLICPTCQILLPPIKTVGSG